MIITFLVIDQRVSMNFTRYFLRKTFNTFKNLLPTERKTEFK